MGWQTLMCMHAHDHLQVWECEMDHEAYRSSKDLNPFDIPRDKDGNVITWCFGKYQNARARLTLRCCLGVGGKSRYCK